MTTKTLKPHAFNSVDPYRRNPHNPRCCDTCGLPETRTDVHTLPDTPVGVAEVEARKLGESS